MKGDKIILAGGSGFLGRTLAKWFALKGAEVIVLSRQQVQIEGARVIQWDAKTLGTWTQELEGCLAVINLAGRSVNCRYHANNRKLMIDSRVDSTRIIGQAITGLESPPKVWLNSSTATIYRHRYDGPNTEKEGLYGPHKEAKDHYSLIVAESWEKAFKDALAQAQTRHQVRGIVLRAAMVFGNEPGGVYEALRRLVHRGLGGAMGHGRQYVSWIHAEDFCRAIEWLIDEQSASGIYNITAPEPLINREMMKSLRVACGKKFGLPAAKWMLELGAFFMRTETELIVKSRKVVPERLLEEGFEFRYERLEQALEKLEA